MATYAAAPSNSEVESWLPLDALLHAPTWAQVMRNISHRAADVGITPDWRHADNENSGGTPVVFPDDDFLVHDDHVWTSLGREYLMLIHSVLNTVVEATELVDCDVWFFAPNEGSLPGVSNIDACTPMVYSRTPDTSSTFVFNWLELLQDVRTVVDALDRLKTCDLREILDGVGVSVDSEKTLYTIGNYVKAPYYQIAGGTWDGWYYLDDGDAKPYPGASASGSECTDPDTISSGGGGAVLYLRGMVHNLTTHSGGVSASPTKCGLLTWSGQYRLSVEVTVTISNWSSVAAHFAALGLNPSRAVPFYLSGVANFMKSEDFPTSTPDGGANWNSDIAGDASVTFDVEGAEESATDYDGTPVDGVTGGTLGGANYDETQRGAYTILVNGDGDYVVTLEAVLSASGVELWDWADRLSPMVYGEFSADDERVAMMAAWVQVALGGGNWPTTLDVCDLVEPGE